MDKIADPSVEQLTEEIKKVDIDASKLTALSQEVISRQATVSLELYLVLSSPRGGESEVESQAACRHSDYREGVAV
jgi:hypothetical protein